MHSAKVQSFLFFSFFFIVHHQSRRSCEAAEEVPLAPLAEGPASLPPAVAPLDEPHKQRISISRDEPLWKYQDNEKFNKHREGKSQYSEDAAAWKTVTDALTPRSFSKAHGSLCSAAAFTGKRKISFYAHAMSGRATRLAHRPLPVLPVNSAAGILGWQQLLDFTETSYRNYNCTTETTLNRNTKINLRLFLQRQRVQL